MIGVDAGVEQPDDDALAARLVGPQALALLSVTASGSVFGVTR
jgi:hypothetical protein